MACVHPAVLQLFQKLAASLCSTGVDAVLRSCGVEDGVGEMAQLVLGEGTAEPRCPSGAWTGFCSVLHPKKRDGTMLLQLMEHP